MLRIYEVGSGSCQVLFFAAGELTLLNAMVVFLCSEGGGSRNYVLMYSSDIRECVGFFN